MISKSIIHFIDYYRNAIFMCTVKIERKKNKRIKGGEQFKKYIIRRHELKMVNLRNIVYLC
jgi:hypothetical protein